MLSRKQMLQTGIVGSIQVMGGRVRKAGYPTERSRQEVRLSGRAPQQCRRTFTTERKLLGSAITQ